VKLINLQAVLVCNVLSGHEDIWGSGGIAPPFLTSALDGGGWSASRPDRFGPGKKPQVPVGQEAGWASEPLWRREKFLSLSQIESRPSLYRLNSLIYLTAENN
jgi:hypothetical protein